MKKRRITSFLIACFVGSVVLASDVEAASISLNALPETEALDITELLADETESPEIDLIECLDNSFYQLTDSAGNEIQTESGRTRYLFLGDSTACGYTDSSGNGIQSYVYYFQQSRSADVSNAAIGGATYASRYIYNIGMELDSVDLSSYDIVFFQFGVNDFARAYPLGNAYSRDTTTVCGALNAAVDRIKAAGAQCYCILPFYYQGQIDHIKNENGLTFDKYLQAIKNTCNQNGVTMIDFNGSLGINSSNFGDYYIDRVHPGAALQQRAGEYLDIYMRAYDDENQVIAFVNRLYELCLGRTADEPGLNSWKNDLINRTKSGAQVAAGFFFSEELQNRNLSDEDFVELLYQVMMDREADEDGKAYWMARLASGVSREGVFKGFAESSEFTTICGDYEIIRGNVTVTQGRDRNTGLTMFVSRLYTKALGREYDIAGLNDWCNRVCDGTWTITEISTTGFFESQEFLNKGLDNEEYVKVLYRTFLDREYDEEGLADWVNKLDTGEASREEVLKGFSYSEEFAIMMKEYGL